tara:strand:+ start:291 stop:1043 length:753 start_codon:yes stop_codon:yes gene_type:complete
MRILGFMAAVKGTKQYDMVVVPHRPIVRVTRLLILLGIFGFSGWYAFEYGKNEGLALKVEVVKERDMISEELETSKILIEKMEQEIADLQVGEAIDNRANEEVRGTIEALQEQLARQAEEIKFYKGIMVPNAEEKGLRIERVNISPSGNNSARYSLLLTQVVDKHNFVQGKVRIFIAGVKDLEEVNYNLSQLDKAKQDSVRFRFRYFQDISGEFVLPEGFDPKEVRVVAESSGARSQKLERSFGWPLNQG